MTGGTGLLGQAIVKRLVARGRRVRALARSDASAHVLQELGATPVRGDVLDPEALARGLHGCAVVYHVAGENAFCLRDPSPLYRVNVTGSRNVVVAAAAAGVSRFVYTSSAAVIGERRGTVGREDSPHRGWFLSHYERSKFEGERAVAAAAAETGLHLVCVNPASVQGPGRTTGTASLLIDFLNGRLSAIVDSRLSLVDIADCTEGHLLAEERGAPGERYLLSGATLTVRDAIAVLAGVTGRDERPRALPPALALATATAAEGIGLLRRRRPRLCRELARTLLHGHAYDGSKAARELGLRYTPLEETIRRTVAWYVERGLVRPPPTMS